MTATAPIRFSVDRGFIEALARSRATLAVTTLPGGLFLLGSGPDLQQHIAYLPLEHAWGLAVTPQTLAVALHREIIVFANSAFLAPRHPLRPNYYDAFFSPRMRFFTGDCLVHDMAVSRNGLLVANTRFSTIAEIDGRYNFNPVWTPPFISAVTPDDRCHLNGIAVEAGEVRYATAFAACDTPEGWRTQDPAAGILLDVAQNAILCEGLCVPHSPRLIDGRLFVLESGTGTVLTVDRISGRTSALTTLPGFVRGLVSSGGTLFVGLSNLRDSARGRKLPISAKRSALVTGVAAIDATSGAMLGMLGMDERVDEVFDLAVIPGMSRAGITDGNGSDTSYAVEGRVGSYWMQTQKI
jgi:uncharacterized protein (TIGR03032 family)